jgi:mRNA interferase RelE/StbE
VNGYTIEYAASTEGELKRLPTKVVVRAQRAIVNLATEPRPRGSLKLQGEENTYRIRVGQYRVVYEIDDEHRIVLITRVRHRRDAYD